MWDECSVRRARSSAKAVTETKWSPNLMPMPNFFNLTINLSIMRLNKSGDSGHPRMATPELTPEIQKLWFPVRCQRGHKITLADP